MKKALQLLLTVAVLFTACKKDTIEHQDAFEDSYKKFNDFKSSFNNSYTYTVVNGSIFGFSSETIIVVKKGKLFSRSYKAYRQSADGKMNVLLGDWKEDESQIGSHNTGADPFTLDQIYDRAKNVWLKADKKTNKIYFETNANGLISSCGSVADGCQDDCFSGITIASIVGMVN